MEGYKPQDFSFFHRSEKLVQQWSDMAGKTDDRWLAKFEIQKAHV